jgi:hypothetical protein
MGVEFHPHRERARGACREHSAGVRELIDKFGSSPSADIEQLFEH